ncbi:redoxin domain-containing protein [Lederbergia graminis]|uniref:Redoxin domain-containing protein n=1 Tax=Lederbergia graminis TaxID=735518 RepID=A0ABW0LQ32_9BACI
MKKTFGVLLLGVLCGILIFHVIQDTKEKKADNQAAEEFLIDAAYETSIGSFAEGVSEGDIPPDFELKTLEGETVRLSDLNGKKVILNFWATWCPPCKAEMPHMQNFYEKKADKYEVEIVAVNLTSNERGSNIEKKVSDFIDEYKLSFPIPLDQSGDVWDKYKGIAIPTTYLIQSNGLVHKRIIGPMDEEMIERLVKEMK